MMPQPIVEDIEIPDAAAASDEEDTFQQLGRLGDEATARETAKKAQEEEKTKAEKKRKRKAKESITNADAEDDTQREKKKKKKKT